MEMDTNSSWFNICREPPTLIDAMVSVHIDNGKGCNKRAWLKSMALISPMASAGRVRDSTVSGLRKRRGRQMVFNEGIIPINGH